MIDALQSLTDNGLPTSALLDVLAILIDNDIGDIGDSVDYRRLIALEWYLGEGNECDPDDCTIEHNDIVSIAPGEYRVLTDGEADAACAEYIEESLWMFSSGFLSSMTGIDESVFEILADKCEDSQDAIKSIIDSSCGVNKFIANAVSVEGRGHFLASYDGEEYEGRNDWYLYRVN